MLWLAGWGLAAHGPAGAVLLDRYDRGSPVVEVIWVDPAAGDDARAGSSREQALRTLTEAWTRIPMSTPLATGRRIELVAGRYDEDHQPAYWESRWGSAQAPVILHAADGPGSAVLASINAYDMRYFYLDGIRIEGAGGDVFHCERCDHLLLSRVTVVGLPDGQGGRAVQEAVKINQSSHVYIEDSDISGAWDNALDMVAVQYGHVLGSRLHDAGDWCQYAKGGSAYLVVAGNEYFDCGTGGFTAGQGTGFEFVVSPWLHYEAYGIQFVNNLIHDVEGAAFGVNGGYNVLMAYNTAYRTGSRSHLFEAVFGLRGCDGDAAACAAHRAVGGWGPATPGGEAPIPNRNVYVYNNLFVNPEGAASAWQHLAVYGPRDVPPGGGQASPARTDENLVLRGNLIWNGPAAHPVGVEGDEAGCRPDNPSCNLGQLLADNAINRFAPILVDPAGGQYAPAPGGDLAGWHPAIPPDFDWSDRPATPAIPSGFTDNRVARDIDGRARGAGSPVGAYAGSLPVHVLGTPAHGATVSGVGVISGYHCQSGDIEVRIDGVSLGKAGAGTTLLGTGDLCGRTDTGYSLLYNFNNLAEGVHVVSAYVDGVLRQSNTFTSVRSGGVPWLAGMTRAVTVADFPEPGRSTTLEWQTSYQNFVVTGGAGGMPSGSPPGPATGALGTPPDGATVSGVGVISGYHCQSRDIEVRIDGTSLGKAGAGTTLLGTAGVCGRTDTGYSLLYNFNNLAEGPHVVSVYADGVLLQSTGFTSVRSGGVPWLADARRMITVADFPAPGRTATLEWQTSYQNFLVTGVAGP
jgi:hypothetical protein